MPPIDLKSMTTGQPPEKEPAPLASSNRPPANPAMGQTWVDPDGDTVRWDGEGWEVVDSKNPQIRTWLDTAADYGAPMVGGTIGGLMGGPVGAGVGSAVGSIAGNVAQGIAGNTDELTDFNEVAWSGASGALGGPLGKMLQKLPRMSFPTLASLTTAMGIGGHQAGVPALAAVPAAWNTAATVGRGVGKVLEKATTQLPRFRPTPPPAPAPPPAEVFHGPLNRMQQAIKDQAFPHQALPEDIILSGVKTPFMDVGRTTTRPTMPGPSLGPSPQTMEYMNRMRMNLSGANPDIDPLQGQVDDAVLNFLKNYAESAPQVFNKVKGSKLR
jgi:outer membrane lipoprotein SlyB